jgi:hypothetical protein
MNYLLTSSIILILLGLLWDRKEWYNFYVKILLLGVGIWGMVLYISSLGYIIKV